MCTLKGCLTLLAEKVRHPFRVQTLFVPGSWDVVPGYGECAPSARRARCGWRRARQSTPRPTPIPTTSLPSLSVPSVLSVVPFPDPRAMPRPRWRRSNSCVARAGTALPRFAAAHQNVAAASPRRPRRADPPAARSSSGRDTDLSRRRPRLVLASAPATSMFNVQC